MGVHNVDNVNVDIAGIIAEGNQKLAVETGKQNETDAADRAAQKKIAHRLAERRRTDFNRDTLGRDPHHVDLRSIYSGASGPEARASLAAWDNNGTLQNGGLNNAQKRLFRTAMADPTTRPGATNTGFVLERFSNLPGFKQAVNTPPLVNTLHGGVLENPGGADAPIGDLLTSRFMQSPTADPAAKNQFLQYGFRQAGRGKLDTLPPAANMLGSFATMPGTTQRAATTFLLRNPDNTTGMQNIDAFVNQPPIKTLPPFARGRATELVLKGDGNLDISQGLLTLSNNPKFKKLPGDLRGRFYTTIGSGRLPEHAGLITKFNGALEDPGFPTRTGQVTKFLSKIATQIKRDGADGVDVPKAIKDSKKPMPPAPKFINTEGLTGIDLTNARSTNESQMRLFFLRLENIYDDAESGLLSATCCEDVNVFHTIRDPPPLDLSSLTPEEVELYERRRSSVMDRVADLRSLYTKQARLWKSVRKSPKQREREALERAGLRSRGNQQRYFTLGGAPDQKPGITTNTNGLTFKPGAPTGSNGPVPLRPPPGQAPGSPPVFQRPAGRAGVPTIDLSATFQNIGTITPENIGFVASTIARDVTLQVTKFLRTTLNNQPVGMADPNITDIPEGEKVVIKRLVTQGQTDGWGIQRTFVKDLGGGGDIPVIKPAVPNEDDGAAPVEVTYNGVPLAKDSAKIRGWGELLHVQWKDLTKAESALLKNLDWNQKNWDSKFTPAAEWPALMATPYNQICINDPGRRAKILQVLQRLFPEACEYEWNARVEKLLMGTPA